MYYKVLKEKKGNVVIWCRHAYPNMYISGYLSCHWRDSLEVSRSK